MARLAAQENMLYYPTPVSQIVKFARHASMYKNSVTILDPCCGEGIAVKALADEWNSRNGRTIGVELDKVRAKDAASRLDGLYCTSIERINIVEGRAHIIFANPPYDEVKGERVEIEWVSQLADMMQVNDYLILVLPNHFYNRSKWERKLLLTMYHKNLRLYRRSYYDEPIGAIPFDPVEYPRFKQAFIVLQKTYRAELLREMPVEENLDDFSKTIVLEPQSESIYDRTNPKLLLEITEGKEFESVITPENYRYIFGESSSDIPVQPLQEMSAEIMAVNIAGGMFSGIEIDNMIIRGGTRVETKEFEVEKDGAKEYHEKDELIAFIAALNTETGELEEYASTSEEFGEQIERLAELIAEKMKKDNPPVFQKDRDMHRYKSVLEEVRSPRVMPGSNDGLLEPQMEKAATIMHGYNVSKLKSVTLIGEMGTGKSVTSLAVAWASVKHRPSHLQKVVILLPPKTDLVEKWGEEEIDNAFRDIPHTTIELTSISDVQRAFATNGLVFMLIRETMAKRTSGWGKIKFSPKCHNCGKPYRPVNREGEEEVKAGEQTFCSECDTKLFQFTRTGKAAKKDVIETLEEYVDKHYEKPTKDIRNLVGDHIKAWNGHLYPQGRAYASVATYIKNHFTDAYFLIVDEAHQYKGGDTARGYASGALLAGAYRSLVMTGTIYNGYASSLFYTLYRSQYIFRESWGYDDSGRFVAYYGLQERITKEKKSENTWSGYTKRTTRVEEKPGVHPAMVTMMLPYVVFMKLAEFDGQIPPQESFTLFVEQESETMAQVTDYLGKIKSAAKDEMMDEEIHSMSLMSQFTWANSGVHDVTPLGDSVKSSATGEEFHLHPIYSEMTKKEEAILRLVQQEKQQGYPTLIFYSQFDRRPIQNRLIPLFQKYGMKLVPMPASVNARKPFIVKSLEEGADAIFCNANLVREGIDLLMFRNIIWASPTPDSILVSQANQRTHRLGQTEKTKVFYLGWNNTYQAEQWTRTAEKVSAMSTMHGDVRSGLAALLGTENLVTQVQASMIEFDTYASDMTIDDLPPLQALDNVVEEEPIPIAAEEWRPRDMAEINKAQQMSMF